MINDIYTLPSFRFVAGGTQLINIKLFDRNENEFYPDADFGIEFAMIHYANRDYSAPLIQIDSSSEQVEFDGGEVNIHLHPSDTRGFYGKYIYQLSATYDEDGETYKDIIGQGLIYVIRDITEVAIRYDIT